MLHELVDAPGEMDPETLHDAYLTELAAAVEAVGVEAATERTGLEASVLSALPDPDTELSLEAAAAVLALAEGRPNAEAIRQESLDHVLLGMTTAVLDVDAVAANIDLDLSPTGIQQRIEGRTEMSLREFAHVYGFVAGRQQ